MYSNLKYIIYILIFLLWIKILNSPNNNVEHLSQDQIDVLIKDTKISARSTSSINDRAIMNKKIRKCPVGLSKICFESDTATDRSIHGDSTHTTDATGVETTDTVNCDTNDGPIFCSVTGTVEETDQTLCTLTPELGEDETTIGYYNNTITTHSKPAPVCSTVPCKEGARLIKPNHGGFCFNSTTGEICAFDPDRANGHKLCDNRQSYLVNENHDIIKDDGTLQFVMYENQSIEECSDLCNRVQDLHISKKTDGTHLSGDPDSSLVRDIRNTVVGGDQYQGHGCDYFTYRKSGDQKGKCTLKQKIEAKSDVKKNQTVDTFMKVPYNYKLYDDMGTSGPDLGQAFKYTDKTITECAKLCDLNDDCGAIVVGKNGSMGSCILKSRINNDLTPNSNKATLSKNWKYYRHHITNKQNPLYDPHATDNVNDKSLCKSSDENPKIKAKIRSTIDLEDDEYNTQIGLLQRKNEDYILNLTETVKTDTAKKTLNFFMNPKSIIIWTQVNTRCHKVRITLLRKDFLQVSLIKILGRVNVNEPVVDLMLGPFDDMITRFPKVTSSSVLDNTIYKKMLSTYSSTTGTLDNKLENCWSQCDSRVENNVCDNSGSLELFFSTENTQNPWIEIKFYDNDPLDTPSTVEITKIFIYNRLDAHQDNLVPLKIELLNSEDSVVKEAIKRSFKEPLQLSKSLPPIPEGLGITDYADLPGTNLGEQSMIREWVKLNNNDRFCSIQKDPGSGIYNLECASIQDPKSIESLPINPGFSQSQYFKDETGNGELDFCRCKGNLPNTYVSCNSFNGIDAFESTEFIPKNKPTGCQNMTGEFLKSINSSNALQTCEEMTVPQLELDGDKWIQSMKNNKPVTKPLLDEYKNINDNIIHAAFVLPQEVPETYFFKNTNFNNKSIVLGHIKTTETTHFLNKMPGFTGMSTLNNDMKTEFSVNFFESIDACCYHKLKITHSDESSEADDVDGVIFFKDRYFFIYDLTNKTSIRGGLISLRWPSIPSYFTYNLTAAVYMGTNGDVNTNTIWLCKGLQYIEIGLNNVEPLLSNSSNETPTESDLIYKKSTASDDTASVDTTILPTGPININTQYDINLKNVDAIFLDEASEYIHFINKHRYIKIRKNLIDGKPDHATDTSAIFGANNKMLVGEHETNLWGKPSLGNFG